MKLSNLVIAICVFALGNTILVNEAHAFEPFKCVSKLASCVSKIAKTGELSKLIKATKTACNQFKQCKKKCGLNKKTCKSFYKSIPAISKTTTKEHWNRICKYTKAPCKSACKASYLTKSCVEARKKLNKFIWKDKKSMVAVCLDAAEACMPFPQVQCAVAVASCIKDNGIPMAMASKKVQDSCQDLKSCKNTCLLKKTRKKMRQCKKSCRKSYREGDCKSARKAFVKAAAKSTLACGGAAVQACGLGL